MQKVCSAEAKCSLQVEISEACEQSLLERMRERQKAQTTGVLITLNHYASAAAKTPLKKKAWTFAFMGAKEIKISIWNPQGWT